MMDRSYRYSREVVYTEPTITDIVRPSPGSFSKIRSTTSWEPKRNPKPQKLTLVHHQDPAEDKSSRGNSSGWFSNFVQTVSMGLSVPRRFSGQNYSGMAPNGTQSGADSDAQTPRYSRRKPPNKTGRLSPTFPANPTEVSSSVCNAMDIFYSGAEPRSSQVWLDLGDAEKDVTAKKVAGRS